MQLIKTGLASLVLCAAAACGPKQEEAPPASAQAPAVALDPAAVLKAACRLTPGSTLTFGAQSPANACLTAGWSKPEAGGVWSSGKSAKLTLYLDPSAKDVTLEFLAVGYVSAKQSTAQEAKFTIGDEAVGAASLETNKPQTFSILIPAAKIVGGAPIVLEIALPNAAVPAQLGDGADVRPLALYLHSVKYAVAG